MNMLKEKQQEPEEGTSKCLENCRRLEWKGCTSLVLHRKPFPHAQDSRLKSRHTGFSLGGLKRGRKFAVLLRLPNPIQSLWFQKDYAGAWSIVQQVCRRWFQAQSHPLYFHGMAEIEVIFESELCFPLTSFHLWQLLMCSFHLCL